MPQLPQITETHSLAAQRKAQDDYEAATERYQFGQIDWETPPERRAFIIREEYTRLMADAEADGRQYLSDPHFIGYHYKWTPNAEATWHCMKAEGVSLLPLFPFLHYFLDFADPYRKVAVLVEEKEQPWDNLEALAEQDRLLGLAGWTVYRISDAVANTYETSLLPAHLGRAPYGEFADDEEAQEYREAREQMNMDRTTIDGFFTWLRQEDYKRAL